MPGISVKLPKGLKQQMYGFRGKLSINCGIPGSSNPGRLLKIMDVVW
jgi:hypothetical protein